MSEVRTKSQAVASASPTLSVHRHMHVEYSATPMSRRSQAAGKQLTYILESERADEVLSDDTMPSL